MPPAVSIGDGRSLSLARSPLPRAPVAYTVLAAAGAVASATAAALTLSGSSGNYAALQAVARALMVGVPVAVGLYAVRHPASARFGALLILAGFGWFVTTLSESPDPWLYSIGRVAGWAVELSIAYLILAFPTGRISTRVDRVLIALATAVLVGLYLPTALLVERYPLPSPWTGCEHACPANALMVAGSEPALIEDVVRPLRELLTIALFVGVSARLAWRMHRATTLGRRALGPVLAVSIFRLAVLAMLLASRRIAPDGVVPQVMSWLSALALPLLALAFLVGVWHWRLFIAAAMQRLAARLHGRPRPAQLQRALAEEFQDPSLEILRPATTQPARWVNAVGDDVRAPSAERASTDVFDGNERVAVISHDPALSHDPAFNAIATSYIVMMLENERLGTQTARLLRDVHEARERARAAADSERLRIEQNLHDGAQQRLVALGIRLGLAAERAEAFDPAAAEALRDLGAEIGHTLDDIRSLAHGRPPPGLTAHGLITALTEATHVSSLPATVLGTGVGRYPAEIEDAAYFCCLEAMQNAAKHARNATTVRVELSDEHDTLRLEVRDDGDGFDAGAVTPGTGVAGMRDRIAAIGGVAAIHSRPGHGTRVNARITLHRPTPRKDAPTDRQAR